MVEGIVKWYSKEKGFGFIGTQDGEDVFFSAKYMPEGMVADLVEGDAVTFKLGMSERGPVGKDIVKK